MKTKLLLMLLVAAALSVPVVAGPIKVINAGFEYDILADGAYQADVGGWLDGYYYDGTFYYGEDDWAGSVYNPELGDFNAGEAPEGQNIAIAYNYEGTYAYDMGLAQILTHKFVMKAKYTLTVEVGNPLYNPDDGTGVYTGNYLIEVLDGTGKVLDSETGSPPALGEWITVTVGPFNKNGGQWGFDLPMEIRLLMLSFPGTGFYDHELAFDDITLSHLDPSMYIVTPDMSTWDGEPVDLLATVDGVTSQTWTADPSDGVVFDPAGTGGASTSDVLDPTVTVTLPGGGLLETATIQNAGFEDRIYGDGGLGYFGYDQSVAGWTRRNNWPVGDINPTADLYLTGAPEGQNCAFVRLHDGNSDKGIQQYLPDTLYANTTYTLTVKVGNPGTNDGWGGYHVKLLAGGEILNDDQDSIPIDPNAWVMSTVTYVSPAEPNQLGETLMIRLDTLKLYIINNDGTSAYIHYDDVKLTANANVFKPPSFYPVTLTVQGDAPGNAVVSPVSIELKVYTDACDGALGIGLQEDTDFDSDCVTGLSDLAEVAKSYADDISLTAPIDD